MTCRNIFNFNFWEDFNLNGTTRYEMRNPTHVPSEELNLKPERLISHKCLNYWRQSLIFWPRSIRQESFPLLKPMNWLLELWLDWPLFVLLAHKYRPSPNLNELVCSLLQHRFPKLQFLVYYPPKLNFW